MSALRTVILLSRVLHLTHGSRLESVKKRGHLQTDCQLQLQATHIRAEQSLVKKDKQFKSVPGQVLERLQKRFIVALSQLLAQANLAMGGAL